MPISGQALIIVLSRAGVFEILSETAEEITFYDAKNNIYKYNKLSDSVTGVDSAGATIAMPKDGV